MTDKAKELADTIREAVSDFIAKNHLSDQALLISLSDGHSLIRGADEAPSQTVAIVHVQIPVAWTATMNLHPKSPTTAGSAPSFACPHCGNSIRYGK